MPQPKPFIIVCATLGLVLVPLVLTAQQKGPAPSDTPRRLATPMKSFMHGKLKSGQEVLEGLLTRDFEQMAAAADALRGSYLTSPAFDMREEFDDKVYEHFHLEFMRLSGKLIEMAEAENLDGAAYAYQNLTATCIACHEHLRDRDERSAQPVQAVESPGSRGYSLVICHHRSAGSPFACGPACEDFNVVTNKNRLGLPDTGDRLHHVCLARCGRGSIAGG